MFTDNPLDFVKMLAAFCQAHRTLAVPAFFFDDPKIACSYATLSRRLRFDLRRAPSPMGLTFERVRRKRGAAQSRHPMCRIAAPGPMARDLTSGHELTEYPNDIGSPFDFMGKQNTQIIGVRTTFQGLTKAHRSEGIMRKRSPLPNGSGTDLRITLVDGTQEDAAKLTGHRLLWEFNSWKLRKIMNHELQKEWNFHHIPLFAKRAVDVTSCLVGATHRNITLNDKP